MKYNLNKIYKRKVERYTYLNKQFESRNIIAYKVMKLHIKNR